MNYQAAPQGGSEEDAPMKKLFSILLILALALSLCACGEAAKSARADYAPNDSYVYTEEAMEAPMWAAEEEGYYGLSAAGAPVPAPNGADTPAERPGKIIYSANVQVETTDFDGSLAKLEELVAEYKGWVESSSVNGSNYNDSSRGRVSRRSANYTLRFPSDRFDELMGSLSVLGNIPFTHTYTENVTAQYYDVQAHLTALSAQEQRLLEMMELAETVEDIIILEDRLTEVRYHIESLQSTLNNWDRQVSYSTVYLDLTEVQEYTPEPQVQPSFGQRLLSALKSGLHGAGEFFSDLLLFLAEALPALLILAAVAVAIILPVRRSMKKRRARMKAAPAPVPAPEEEQP